jgi:hypothetical protein
MGSHVIAGPLAGRIQGWQRFWRTRGSPSVQAFAEIDSTSAITFEVHIISQYRSYNWHRDF